MKLNLKNLSLHIIGDLFGADVHFAIGALKLNCYIEYRFDYSHISYHGDEFVNMNLLFLRNNS